MASLQEASAELFLALGGWESLTDGIFAFCIAGRANEAAAISVVLINRVAGTRMGRCSGRIVRHRPHANSTNSREIAYLHVLVFRGPL